MADLDFDLVPVAFETSGAMGPSAKKWWKTIKELYAAKNPHGDAALQGRGGSVCTWTAGNFVDHWAQRIGTALARAQGEILERKRGAALPDTGAAQAARARWRHTRTRDPAGPSSGPMGHSRQSSRTLSTLQFAQCS